jgi:hypothetical protein
MMFPKHRRVKSQKTINQLKKQIDCCERCGSRLFLEAAHIIGKGRLGPDMRENIVILCGPAAWGKGCHGADHQGKIQEDELFAIAAKREGITLSECRLRVRVAMGKE